MSYVVQNFPNNSQMQTALNLASEYNQLAVFHLHNLGDTITESEFRTRLQQIKDDDNLEVITFEDWYKMLQTHASQAAGPRSVSGTETFSGDGSTTTFTVSHGADVSAPPESIQPDLSTDAVAVDGYQNVSVGSFDVVFSSAPASGSDNVTVHYSLDY